jgi:hypothetical protein
MLRGAKELWLSLAAVAGITAMYALIINLTSAIPAAGEFYGHTLGILGFMLMLMTETLYSLRKRSRTRVARWGRMSDWLQFHIFTGIVGPYLVLLHSSWKFNGLAGATMLLTVVIVISGFIGRYIYTRIPRTLDGIEVDSTTGGLQASALAQSRRLMALWHTIHIPIGMALFVSAFIHIFAALYCATLLKPG